MWIYKGNKMISKYMVGRDTIKLLKDMFDIKGPVKSLVLTADCDDVTTIEVTSYLTGKDVNITSKELISNTDTKRYEVTVKSLDLDNADL